MKDSRAKRSPPGLPLLASTQTSPRLRAFRATVGFPTQFGISTHLPGALRFRVQAAVWLGIVWAPPSSGSRLTLSDNRRSAHRQGLGFTPLKNGLGARALCPSALPAGLPLVPYKQAACRSLKQALSLVRAPTCMDQEQSSTYNKIYTGRLLLVVGGHVPTLPGKFRTASDVVGGGRLCPA
eukprot:1195529-Prorocentrum_minimum.AAC.4